MHPRRQRLPGQPVSTGCGAMERDIVVDPTHACPGCRRLHQQSPGCVVCVDDRVHRCRLRDGFVHRRVHVPIAEQWNGASWAMQFVPNPGTGSNSDARLDGVVCVDRNVHRGRDIRWRSLCGTLNGTSWSLESIPNAAVATFVSVSCASPTECTAAGSAYANSERVPVIGQWNGNSWSAQTLGPGRKCGRVSIWHLLQWHQCVHGGRLRRTDCWWCMSVSVVDDPGRAMERHLVDAAGHAEPSGASISELNGVACAATVCTAVGDAVSPNAVSLAEQWNGTAWTIQPTPTPPPPGGATSEGVLPDGVSCTAPDACTAVGSYNSLDPLVASSIGRPMERDRVGHPADPEPDRHAVRIRPERGVVHDRRQLREAAGSQRNTSGYEVTVAEQYSA